jgi:hypothetical protein
VSQGLFGTPRPVPTRRGPALGALVLLALALPIYLVAGVGIGGWLLGTGLWIGGEVVAALLTRLPLGLSNLGASGAVGVGLIFRQLVAVVALFAVMLHHKHLAIAALVLYAAAYTFELALSMLVYFGQEKRA